MTEEKPINIKLYRMYVLYDISIFSRRKYNYYGLTKGAVEDYMKKCGLRCTISIPSMGQWSYQNDKHSVYVCVDLIQNEESSLL